MRRPPPLPSGPSSTPTPGRTDSGVESGIRDLAPRSTRPVPPDDPDSIETAPVEGPWHLRPVPDGGETSATADVRDGMPGSRVGADSAAGADEPEGVPSTEAARLGPRDVWAAARARRRALRREMRRFTARQRRRRWVWIAVGSTILALTLGSVAVAYSPLFSVERITVVGTTSLNVPAVQEALAGELGTPIPLIDESAVKSALVGFPLVESYSLEARPPHELVVRIVERTPVGSLASDGGFVLVDAAGVTLSTTPDQPQGYPLIEVEGGLGSDAFASAGRVFRSLPPEVRGQVTTLAATTSNDVTLTLADGRSVVWGGPEESARKLRVLDALMTARADASVYDVSSPLAAVVR